MSRYEYATMEWLWDAGGIRVDLPGGETRNAKGEYAAVVQTLNELGRDGWEVASCVTNTNWTLIRRA